MLDRLRQLDERLLPAGEAAQDRGGQLALSVVGAVCLLAMVATLHDGQTPKDWQILVPAAGAAALMLRSATAADLPGGALLAKAATGAAVFLAMLVGGMSSGIAAVVCLVGVGAWATRT